MQRTALLACLAVCRTVSMDALHVLAAAMPWDLVAIKVAIIYKVKRGLALTPSGSIVDLNMSSIERKTALCISFRLSLYFEDVDNLLYI